MLNLISHWYFVQREKHFASAATSPLCAINCVPKFEKPSLGGIPFANNIELFPL